MPAFGERDNGVTAGNDDADGETELFAKRDDERNGDPDGIEDFEVDMFEDGMFEDGEVEGGWCIFAL